MLEIAIRFFFHLFQSKTLSSLIADIVLGGKQFPTQHDLWFQCCSKCVAKQIINHIVKICSLIGFIGYILSHWKMDGFFFNDVLSS